MTRHQESKFHFENDAIDLLPTPPQLEFLTLFLILNPNSFRCVDLPARIPFNIKDERPSTAILLETQDHLLPEIEASFKQFYKVQEYTHCLLLKCHHLWRHHLTSYDVIFSQAMTSSPHKIWRHHLKSYDVIISQVMTSSSHKIWRHHLTSYDVTFIVHLAYLFFAVPKSCKTSCSPWSPAHQCCNWWEKWDTFHFKQFRGLLQKKTQQIQGEHVFMCDIFLSFPLQSITNAVKPRISRELLKTLVWHLRLPSFVITGTGSSTTKQRRQSRLCKRTSWDVWCIVSSTGAV